MKKSTIVAIAAVTSAIVTTIINVGLALFKKETGEPHRIIIGGSLGDILNALNLSCDGNCDTCEERDDCEYCEQEEETKTSEEQKEEPRQSFKDAVFYE